MAALEAAAAEAENTLRAARREAGERAEEAASAAAQVAILC